MNMDSGHSLQKWLQGNGRETTRGMISNNGDVLMEAAIAGTGIALQPTFMSGNAGDKVGQKYAGVSRLSTISRP